MADSSKSIAVINANKSRPQMINNRRHFCPSHSRSIISASLAFGNEEMRGRKGNTSVVKRNIWVDMLSTIDKHDSHFNNMSMVMKNIDTYTLDRYYKYNNMDLKDVMEK